MMASLNARVFFAPHRLPESLKQNSRQKASLKPAVTLEEKNSPPRAFPDSFLNNDFQKLPQSQMMG
jgi:hypothetical protein